MATTRVPKPGNLQKGQLYDHRMDITTPFEQQVENFEPGDFSAELGQAAREILPKDPNSVDIKRFVANTTGLDSKYFAVAGYDSFDFPPQLVSLTPVFEITTGSGSHNESGGAEAAGDRSSLSLSLSGDASASAAIIPDIIPVFKHIWGNDIPVMNYFFFGTSPITLTQIRDRLRTLTGDAGLLMWPVFKPVGLSIICRGQRVSINASTSVKENAAVSSGDVSRAFGGGGGTSSEVGAVVREKEIRPTLHAALAPTPLTATTEDFTVVSESEIEQLGDGTVWLGIDATRTATGNVTGTITLPGGLTALAATSPTAVPTSGNYARIRSADVYEFGYMFIHAQVVDFGLFV